MVNVHKIAVLGAGLGGAQVAAFFANLGHTVYLYDEPAHAKDVGIAAAAIERLSHIHPLPLTDVKALGHLEPKNYAEHLSLLQECGLIIESVADNFELKCSLYAKVARSIGPKAVLVSNTSALSIARLAHELPTTVQQRFFGLHFFNPTKYLPLVELVPHQHSDQMVVQRVHEWLELHAKKKVIVVQDSPGFIANRFGIFALLVSMHHAHHLGLTPDCVDLLLGSAMGRASSAVFNTLDLIGLDTFSLMVKNLYYRLEDDPWRQYFQVPESIEWLIHRGCLGQKNHQGFYKVEGEQKLVWDPQYKTYAPIQRTLDKNIQALLDLPWREKLPALVESEHPYAKLIWRSYRDLLHYISFHFAEVANTAEEIDCALRWGFGWKQGPLALWQESGWHSVANAILRDIETGKTLVSKSLPNWVRKATFQGPYIKDQVYCAKHDEYLPQKL